MIFGYLTSQGNPAITSTASYTDAFTLTYPVPSSAAATPGQGGNININAKAVSVTGNAAIQSNLRETTTRVLASLTPREERVLRMRFGIGMNTDHTLEEVGQQFSVTRERIRQIEAKALRKLKHPSRSRKMRSFLDQ